MHKIDDCIQTSYKNSTNLKIQILYIHNQVIYRYKYHPKISVTEANIESQSISAWQYVFSLCIACHQLDFRNAETLKNHFIKQPKFRSQYVQNPLEIFNQIFNECSIKIQLLASCNYIKESLQKGRGSNFCLQKPKRN